MANQLIPLSPQKPDLLGLFREDSIFITCDTSIGAFSTTMPEGILSKCHNVAFYNMGENTFTLNFQVKSRLYFYNGAVTSIVIGGGGSIEMFNEPTSGKWRSVTDLSIIEPPVIYPSVRLIWEDDRLKGQVYQDGAWHTCIKGGY